MTRATVALVASLAVLAGCGRSGGDAAVAPGELEGSITVAAAASLADAFTEIADDLMAAHPAAEVALTLDSSSVLATQVLDGAPADVYAAADPGDMDRVVAGDRLAGDPVRFARNRMVIVTRPGNPFGIDGPADLDRVGVVALCAEEAPCGRYAAEVLDAAGVSIPASQVTRTRNVSGALTAVGQGDAAAGIVYASDAVRAGDAVDAVDIPTGENVVATYPIGVVEGSAAPDVAAAFVEAVLAPSGQAVLEEAGFLPAA